MEKARDSNHTDGAESTDGVESYPSPPFPAWVPAVTVAISMLMFLAGSFYYRHRKVLKKRQILMDYFHIIFQYGGVRRKRMVAALCNTNAITLRELGRSFMISFDSLANADNSCPFYPDESAFTGRHGSPNTQTAQKKSFFKNRGMTITKKYRGPFIRINTQPEENATHSAVSFQDIVMKFKGRRPSSNVASAQSTPNRRGMLSPQYEGSSMCTIHGDDFDYQRDIEDNDFPVNYNRQRRNAYVVQYDPPLSRTHEGAVEVGRHSLGHIMPDHFFGQPSPYSGKRNSEPFPHLHDHSCDHSLGQCQQSCVFQVPGDLLSPANVVCGSHGFIPIAHEQGSPEQHYRNSEPTILIHSPSTDGETPQGWNDIRSRNTNGIVFLKRVPKTDGAPGVFYYEEQRTPSPERAGRAGLSKVSYVPSGNMNEYYNCFHSTIKQKNNKEDITSEKTTGRSRSPRYRRAPPKTKGSRLSIGDLAISNFNRRIDFSSQSLQDPDSDQPADSRESQDSSRSISRTTWTRLKNVFSGSRAAQGLQGEAKASKSLPVKQDRQRRRRNRRSTSWQKFVSVFTGFRSLPETKKSASVDIPRASNSFPLGLDVHISKCDENLDTFDLESDTDNGLSQNIRPWISETSRHAESLGTGRSTYDRVSSTEDSDTVLRSCGRPTTLHMPLKTNSFPEELIHGRRYFKRIKTVFDANRVMQGKTAQPPPRTVVRRYRKRNDKVVASSLSLPQSQRDFNCYAFQAGYSPFKDEYRFADGSDSVDGKPRGVTPTIPDSEDSETQNLSRCFGSLSPLPERLQALRKEGRLYALKSGTVSDSNNSLYWTPVESDKTFLFHGLDSQSNCNDGLTASGDASQPPGVIEHSASPALPRVNTYGSPKSKPNLSEMKNHTFASGKVRDMQNIYFDSFNSVRSPLAEQEEDNLDNSRNITSFNPSFGSVEKLPQMCHLGSEQKLVAISCESLYYDTVSALESPSPSEQRHFLRGSSSGFSLSPVSPECMRLQDHRGETDRANELASVDFKCTQNSFAAPLETHSSNTALVDNHVSFSSTLREKSPKNSKSTKLSPPLLAVDKIWANSSLKANLLLACCSHLSKDNTFLSMPVFDTDRSQSHPTSYGHERSRVKSFSHSKCTPGTHARRHSSPSPIFSTRRPGERSPPKRAHKLKDASLTLGAKNNLPMPHCTPPKECQSNGIASTRAAESFGQAITSSESLRKASNAMETVDGTVYVNFSPYDTLI